MLMYKATVVWGGFKGAPGYTNLYAVTDSDLAGGAATFATGIQTFLNSAKNGLASSTSLAVNQTMEILQDSDGELQDIISLASAPASLSGGLGPAITGPTGACIDWLTAGATFGRRRQGRTFLVPVATASIQSDGTLDDTYRTNLTTAANTYANSSAFNAVVWVRPKEVKPRTTPKTYVHPGVAVPIVGARVPDMAAVLRSRRD